MLRLGRAQLSSRSIDEFHCDFAAQRGSDIYQRVQRKAGDAAAEQVVDARLGDSATGGGFGLGPAFPFDDAGDLLHQCRTQLEVGCFLRRVGAVREEKCRSLDSLCSLGMTSMWRE